MLMLTSQSTELQSYCPLRILLTVQIHTPVFLVPQIYELIYHVLQQNNRHHRINANCIRLAERYIFIYVSQKRPKKISGDHLGQRSSSSQLCFFLSAHDVDAFNIQCVATGYSLSLCNIHRKQQEQINNKSLRYNGRDVSPLKEDDIQHVKLNKHSLYHCSISQLIHHTECC